MILKLILFSVLAIIVSAEKVRYDNYALYKVNPETEEQLKFLKDLYEKNEEYDFWKAPSHVGEYVSLVSPPELKEELEHSLKKRSIYSEITLNNLQEAFDAQLYSRRKRDTREGLYWTNYQTIDEIYGWFSDLERNNSNVVSVVTIGQTHEGRNITGIKISRGSGDRVFFLQAGELGADWLSPVILTYIANELIFSNDPEIKAAAEDFTWYIFPLTNPDGFQFSQDSVRLWMKNRRPISTGVIGVDLSKNWNSQWGVSGGSHSPSASNFIGEGPFSEPETRQLSNFIDSVSSKLTAFLSFRSFGQRFLIPFAHSNDPIYNYNEMVTIGRRAMGSLAVRYNTQYLVGTSKAVHDGATGSITDWVKYRYRPRIAATYMLRDTGNSGFSLPVNQITPTAEETLDSLLAIIREAKFINVL
ncbi:zinc carboxypeptidase-like [Helicoverpa armigera]|uniref:zinc carboxypeptidase-like n=1 Tax=Helicoverpa armigera TaxID=29058 RepID=UPI0030836495